MNRPLDHDGNASVAPRTTFAAATAVMTVALLSSRAPGKHEGASSTCFPCIPTALPKFTGS
jgi:hypothetical protein